MLKSSRVLDVRVDWDDQKPCRLHIGRTEGPLHEGSRSRRVLGRVVHLKSCSMCQLDLAIEVVGEPEDLRNHRLIVQGKLQDLSGVVLILQVSGQPLKGQTRKRANGQHCRVSWQGPNLKLQAPETLAVGHLVPNAPQRAMLVQEVPGR